MPDKSELYALLREIDALKENVNRLERRVKAMLAEGERTGQHQQNLTQTLTAIINRLEKERGYAPIDAIMAQAVRAGFDKREVEAELARLVG